MSASKNCVLLIGEDYKLHQSLEKASQTGQDLPVLGKEYTTEHDYKTHLSLEQAIQLYSRLFLEISAELNKKDYLSSCN